MKNIQKNKSSDKSVVRKCHCCDNVTESNIEPSKCVKCGKSFLPLNYFEKVHGNEKYKFDDLFSPSHEIHEEDIIKGLFVLW